MALQAMRRQTKAQLEHINLPILHDQCCNVSSCLFLIHVHLIVYFVAMMMYSYYVKIVPTLYSKLDSDVSFYGSFISFTFFMYVEWR